MRGSGTVRRVATSLSVIVGAVVLSTAALTASPVAADAPIGGPLLASRGLIVDVPPGTPPLPMISSQTFVLADLDSGAIIAAKDPHHRLRPASTQKMLTALTLLPRLDKKDTYVAHRSDVTQDGASVGLVEGHRYTIDELFLGMLLPSGNDAAHALARAGGGVRATRELMMAEAHRLQAMDTTVVNSSGLDEPGQFSSAYDLALFARAGMARADFRRYVGMRTARFPGDTRRETYQIQNQNRLLGKYAGTIGVKTGYTTLAGNTFAVAVKRGDRTLLLTLMHSDGAIREDAKALMDWGFANADLATPVGQLVEPLQPAAVATPTATPSQPVAQPGELSPAFPFAAPVAAGAGSLVVLSGLTALGLRRRRKQRQLKVELAYRAAGSIRYAPPPGPLVARARSRPGDYEEPELALEFSEPGPPPRRSAPPGPRTVPRRSAPPGPSPAPRRSTPPGPIVPPGPHGRPGPAYNGRGPGLDRDEPDFEPELPPELWDDLEPPGSSYPDHGRELDVHDRPPPPPGRNSGRRRGRGQYR